MTSWVRARRSPSKLFRRVFPEHFRRNCCIPSLFSGGSFSRSPCILVYVTPAWWIWTKVIAGRYHWRKRLLYSQLFLVIDVTVVTNVIRLMRPFPGIHVGDSGSNPFALVMPSWWVFRESFVWGGESAFRLKWWSWTSTSSSSSSR